MNTSPKHKKFGLICYLLTFFHLPASLLPFVVLQRKIRVCRLNVEIKRSIHRYFDPGFFMPMDVKDDSVRKCGFHNFIMFINIGRLANATTHMEEGK
jgi:hypothetical protein